MSAIGEAFWMNYRTRQRKAEWDAENPSAQLHHDIPHLEGRIDKLTLICRALFELLQKEHGWTDDKLLAKVAEIDLRDGSLDGKLETPIFDCPECGRRVNAKHGRCLYCGADDFHRDPFDEV